MMSSVINALIRAEGDIKNVSDEFEQVRPDLDIAVIELSVDRSIEEWEAEVISTMDRISITNLPDNRYVAFIETVGHTPVAFSSGLLKRISEVGMSLEHFHHSE